MKNVFAIVAIGLLAIGLTGCPDYSHLKEVPDYSSQRDSDSGDLSPEERAKVEKEEAAAKERSEE